jgi:hypothetical protein
LRDRPFWIWDIIEHKQQYALTKGNCCFNHIIGLAQKSGISMPLFDYEKLLYDALIIDTDNVYLDTKKQKHLWLLKTTGIGATEFFIRLMAWLCLRNDDMQNCNMCVVTGPRIELSREIVNRIKGLFYNSTNESFEGMTFDSKETVCYLNKCKITSFPSHHIDSMHALTDVKFILCDEADFLPKSEQDNVRVVCERYITKSDPYIVLISTPHAPNGLMDKIGREPDDACIYKRFRFDYTVGLDRIYTKEEIDKAKGSKLFDRE